MYRFLMELHLLGVSIFLCLALVSHASPLPSEVYWQRVLPNTPMPTAIRDILRPALDGKDSAKPIAGATNWMANIYQRAYFFAFHGEQLQNDLNVANFFLQKDLHPGSKMKLYFTKFTNGSTFLPREVADSIPFSSTKLPEILNQFSMKPKSAEAQMMKETIEECELSSIEGEDKYCATSLESLIDFSTAKLGQKVQALSTEVETGDGYYKIGVGMKMVGDKAVACHKQNYPYAVFYCHATGKAKTYTVPLVDAKGTKSQAVALCHTDTSGWNPMHVAFQVLKVKRGTVPICHFLPNNHIMWVPN